MREISIKIKDYLILVALYFILWIPAILKGKIILLFDHYMFLIHFTLVPWNPLAKPFSIFPGNIIGKLFGAVELCAVFTLIAFIVPKMRVYFKIALSFIILAMINWLLLIAIDPQFDLY